VCALNRCLQLSIIKIDLNVYDGLRILNLIIHILKFDLPENKPMAKKGHLIHAL